MRFLNANVFLDAGKCLVTYAYLQGRPFSILKEAGNVESRLMSPELSVAGKRRQQPVKHTYQKPELSRYSASVCSNKEGWESFLP